MTTGMIIGLVCLGILVVAVLAIIGIVWSSYNSLVRWDEEANNGFADINVACKMRYDLFGLNLAYFVVFSVTPD